MSGRSLLAIVAAPTCAAVLLVRYAVAQTPAQAAGEWRAYGREGGNTRSSPLAQITRGNVARLEVAWTYRTGETARDRFPVRFDPHFEGTPLLVDGTLYLSTPLGRVIALHPIRARERWTYDAKPHIATRSGVVPI